MANSKFDIGINVKGVILRTNRAALTRFPESMLAKMFNPEMNDDLMQPAQKDSQGNYLINPENSPFSIDHDPEVRRDREHNFF